MTNDKGQKLKQAATPNEAVEAIKALVAQAQPASDDVITALIGVLSHHHPAVPAAAVDGLVELASASVNPLIAAFEASGDQAVQAHIIQALARIGDPKALSLLDEVIGTSVANHCQGNVRRVAARGLGRIGSLAKDTAIISQAIDKLTWALLTPEDWALRYAAIASLQDIAQPEVMPPLQQALTQESDRVVQARLNRAIAQLQSII